MHVTKIQSTLHTPLAHVFAFFFFLLLTTYYLLPTAFASDAIMEVSPSVGTFHVNDEVEFRVTVTSGEEKVSAAEGRISYNPKELVITHVFTENSVLSSWIQKPSVDREVGEIIFGGAMASSSRLVGSTIFTIRARPERAGDTHLRFEGGAAIISADGLGSNILTSFKSGAYRILPEELNQELDVPSTPPAENLASVVEASGEVLGVATTTPRQPEEVVLDPSTVATSTPVPPPTTTTDEEDLPPLITGTLDAPPPPVVDKGFFARHPSLPLAILLFFLLIIFAVRIFRTMAREAIEAETPPDDHAVPQSGVQVILSPRIRN